MNRSLRESVIGGRYIPVRSQHRRGLSLNGISKNTNDNLDLFSTNHRSPSLASSDESDVSVKLERLSVGSAKVARSGIDDLLSSTDGGKHDYDWLLTPPETPLFPSSDGNEPQPASAAPRTSSSVRSVSATKASKLSVSQSESNHPSRPTRSSSVTRPSISSSHYNTYSNKSSSILNTSSASVSSYIRPSTPTRSSTARPSTPSARPAPSRSSTPSRARQVPSSFSIDKTRPSQNSRPSTPSSRPQIPANLNSTATRSVSRPSTPTRRNPAPSLSPVAGPSTSVRATSNGRNMTPGSRPSSPSPRVRPPPQPINLPDFPLDTPPNLRTNGRNPAPSLSPTVGSSTLVGCAASTGRSMALGSRPSSPSPRVRPPPQQIVLPDFPLDTPPNLRTTLPDRPLSAGRSRPGVAITVKGNIENPSPVNLPKRQSSPIVSRGRLTEPTGRGRVHANGKVIDSSELRAAPRVSELSMRKPVKTSSESMGLGRTISKKSLDMAIRHMDFRNGTSGIRSLTGSTLFPQSVRSANPRSQRGHTLSAPASVNGDLPVSSNRVVSENGCQNNRSPENGTRNRSQFSSKFTEVDSYESSRYDAILLKEDMKNMNWLHNVDDKSDQELIFDNGFGPLPEPFGPL